MRGQARRIEMFSDGVFAIAITLLVLELPFGKVHEGQLAAALKDHWATFAAYALSFVGIGIAWLQHHAVFDHVKRVASAQPAGAVRDRLLPYPTSLLGEYIHESDNASTAAIVYSGAWTVATIALSALWTHAVRAGATATPAARRLMRYYWATAAAYVLYTVVAAFSAIAMLALYSVTAILFLARSDYQALDSEPSD
jgi:uncharacterized membrane protein